MSVFSIFSKKPTEATSVEEALAGAPIPSSSRSRNRKSEKSNSEVEQLVPERKRAQRRLIGAVTMVLAVVVGLPLVLDTEPKALNRNIPIHVASQQDAATSSHSGESLSVEQDSTEADPSLGKSKIKEDEEAPSSNTPVATSTSRDSDAKKDGISSSNKDVAESERSSTKPQERIVVQIGAFTTQEKVKELRGKLSSAGIKSYTQKIATKSGDKIRVRVGPFEDKDDAEKVKTKLKGMGLNGTLLSLD